MKSGLDAMPLFLLDDLLNMRAYYKALILCPSNYFGRVQIVFDKSEGLDIVQNVKFSSEKVFLVWSKTICCGRIHSSYGHVVRDFESEAKTR